MDKLIVITPCEDGSCCCLPPRGTVALISILSMVVCMADFLSSDSSDSDCAMKDYLDSMRLVLTTMFQLANIVLLAASVVENAFLVSIYVWYTLGFIVMGLCVALIDLLFRFKNEGARGLLGFVTEVGFLFVISRCLPLVDTYRKHLITKY